MQSGRVPSTSGRDQNRPQDFEERQIKWELTGRAGPAWVMFLLLAACLTGRVVASQEVGPLLHPRRTAALRLGHSLLFGSSE